MKKLIGIVVGLAFASCAFAQDSEPVVHIQKWSDLICPTGKTPTIRLHQDTKKVEVTCE